MKKFIRHLFLFLLPFFLVACLLEVLLRNIPNDFTKKGSYLEKHSNNIETLILGSSHTFWGVDPRYIRGNSYNAAQVAQILDNDVSILWKYKDKLRSLKVIIVPISYFSLYTNSQNTLEKWRRKNYVIYYNIWDGFELSNCFELTSLSLKVNLKRLSSYYIHGDKNISSNEQGFGNLGKIDSNLDFEASGKHAAALHTVVFNGEVVASNLVILRDVIQLSKQKNVRVIFFTPPGYYTYSKCFDHNQLKNTISLATKIANENRNVSYFNMLNDGNFVKQDYRDADHLNVKGAAKLSAKLDSLIWLKKY